MPPVCGVDATRPPSLCGQLAHPPACGLQDPSKCHRCRDTELSPMSRDITPGSPDMVSKSDTKEPNNVSPSHTNRGIMQFCQTRSVLGAAFVSDVDTPTAPGSSARLEPHGRPFAGNHRYPRSPGPGRDTPPHPATPSFSWTVTVLSGWPDIDRPGGWIVWTITLRQPGSMSTDTSPFHRSRPPSQQVRPTSPTRSRGPGRTCPPGSWRRHRCPARTGSSEASRCGRICRPCRVAGPGSTGRRWRTVGFIAVCLVVAWPKA